MRKTLAVTIFAAAALAGASVAHAVPSSDRRLHGQVRARRQEQGLRRPHAQDRADASRDTAGGLRPALTNTTLRFPKGAVVNARYFKRCNPEAPRDARA